MINIYTNSSNNSSLVYSNATNSLKNSDSNTSTSASTTDKTKDTEDTVQLSDENTINVAKVRNVFSKTLADFKGTTYGMYGDMTGPLAEMNIRLLAEGKQGIDFSSDSNMSFIDYTNNLIDIAKQNPKLVPSNFLDFCNELKSNLKKAGCK